MRVPMRSSSLPLSQAYSPRGLHNWQLVCKRHFGHPPAPPDVPAVPVARELTLPAAPESFLPCARHVCHACGFSGYCAGNVYARPVDRHHSHACWVHIWERRVNCLSRGFGRRASTPVARLRGRAEIPRAPRRAVAIARRDHDSAQQAPLPRGPDEAGPSGQPGVPGRGRHQVPRAREHCPRRVLWQRGWGIGLEPPCSCRSLAILADPPPFRGSGSRRLFACCSTSPAGLRPA